MGRKKQQNDFFFFMMEKKSEVEKKMGKVVSMAELPGMIYPEWKAMPEEEKRKYRNMSANKRGDVERLDCRGIPLAEIQQEQEKKKRKIEEMKSYIANNVSMLHSGNALHCGKFYIVSASYYVLTEEGHYAPAEIGLVQFSFQRGIIKEFHMILKPVIPLSYGYLAQVYSEMNHKLLEEENTVGEDREAAATALKEFVEEESNRLPPLYTLEAEMPQAEAVLSEICGPGYFSVYSVDQLFQHLYSVTFADNPIPLSIASDMLTHCSLDYHPSLPCEWHQTYQKDAGRYCSLACSKRWAYHMCDNMKLLETFGIQPQEGKHIPEPIPAFGIVVDVPRHTFKDSSVQSRGASNSRVDRSYGDGASSFLPRQQANSFKSRSKEVPKNPKPEKPQNDTGFSFTRKAKVEAAPAGAPARGPARPKGSWSNAVASPSPRAPTLATSFSASSVDTSCEEDFPALGARNGFSGNSWNTSSHKRGQKKN
ncbi:protein maelstrom homolog [Penaeus japonicus]|uniref:protein maelstrom homolog n=1 Tax=Penaeus japonicus TaxID=27405 RepID=UPI001C716535|nr:protein maelstrom homolog [Penaeus japonicus]